MGAWSKRWPDEYRTDYDPDILSFLFGMTEINRGGYGKLVQKELEAQRELVDYGAGSLGAYSPPAPSNYGRRGGGYGQGVSTRPWKRRTRFPSETAKKDDRYGRENSRRNSDCETRRDSDHDMRPIAEPDLNPDWLALHGALSVREQFALRQIPFSPCQRCKVEESISHFLFSCPYGV
ncbi:hypothetical protein Bca4012_060228 [Brassica carinata]